MTLVAIIVFVGLLFLSLILMMQHFMKANLTGALGHLQKLNDELVKQQNDLKQKMSDSQKEYEVKMVKLQQEMTTRQAQIKEEANKSIEESRNRALQEREKIINEAVETREKMRQEVMAEMEEKAIAHSKILIGEFFTGELRKMIHDVLVQDVVDGLQEVDMTHYQINTDTAELKVSQAIDPQSKKKIAEILKGKIKKEVKFAEEVDPSLIGGLILKFGTFVIDGSLMNRLSESAARLQKETARRYQGTL
jgi:F0F1-type ATP synthase membrane subunit b/b'